jgi:Spy/CpxP family protein refolding chaperone
MRKRKMLLLALVFGLTACSHEQPPAQSGAPQTTGGAMETSGSAEANSSQPTESVPPPALGAVQATPDVAPTEQASQPQQDQPSDGSPNAWHGGLLRSALELSSLTPTQKNQIQTLIQQKQTANANVQMARSQLLNALADAVDSGNVSAMTIAPKVQAMVTAIEANEPGDRGTLESLHAILTPIQRTVLANDVELRLQSAEQQVGQVGSGQGIYLGWWSSKLNLTPAQQNQVETNYRTFYNSIDPNARAKLDSEHMRLLEAFKGSTFVMNQVVPLRTGAEIELRVEHMVNMARAATPVLTAEQRATATSLLRSRAIDSSGM